MSNIYKSQQSATLEEGKVDVEVVRMQVTDRDTKGTEASNVNYVIHGKSGENFRIDTNPESNEGVLYAIKVFFFLKYRFLIPCLFRVPCAESLVIQRGLSSLLNHFPA